VLAKELLRGHVVARIDLDRPKLNLVQARDEREEAAEAARPGRDAADVAARSAGKPGQEAHETPQIGRKLAELSPFLVDRVQIRGGEILWIDAREPKKSRIWLHAIEATLENFASRPALARGEPTVLAARGTLQESGRLSFFATADPLAKKLTFAGQGRLEGLRLAELGELLAAKQEVVPDKGRLDMSIRFRAVEGRLSGGVRPFLQDAGTRPAAPGLGPRLNSFLADASLEIFKDEVPGREAVGTTIPISGRGRSRPPARPDDPRVIRNAFVRGLADSVAGCRRRRRRREGVLQQARRALSPGRGKQPRAQPAESKR
jgi:hypothetical protein